MKLKRVPLDFDWPLNKVWGGYINPYASQAINCPNCDRTGYSLQAKHMRNQWYGKALFDPVAYGAKPLTLEHPAVLAFAQRNVERAPEYYGTGSVAIAHEARRLFDLWRYQWCHHLIQADVDALIEADRLWDFTRVPRDAGQAFVVAMKTGVHGENLWLPESNGYIPTAGEVNAWSLRGSGHDESNMYVCLRGRCAREGVPVECARCAGKATLWPTAEIEHLYEEWENIEPPTGDGFQLWETYSEGSPVSPVFTSLDELCAWASEHATTFADFKAPVEKWREMLEDGIVYHKEGNNVFL